MHAASAPPRAAASMRPRPEGRGEPTCATQTRLAEVLQCGHGPKAVENGPADVRCPRVQLQCGHGPKAVENLRAPAVIGTPPASMRPRPEGRGERTVLADPGAERWCFNAATARRPWRTALERAADPGPGFNAATARRPWRTYKHDGAEKYRIMLQCGHGPKAVENLESSQTVPQARSGFNAATARRPWRTCEAIHLDDLQTLQCGHGPKAVENDEERCNYDRYAGCFNAATARRPWRTAAP